MDNSIRSFQALQDTGEILLPLPEKIDVEKLFKNRDNFEQRDHVSYRSYDVILQSLYEPDNRIN